MGIQSELGRTAAGLRPILEPRSVAVIGASRKAGAIGAALLDNLVRCGFKGPIYPVNPSATEISGLKAWPGIKSIGAPVDLAVICVPASGVEAVVRECAESGVRGLVVISAGFRELSAEGGDAERRLRDLAREAGMRMVGPNCMGVLNTNPDVSLNATFAPTWPPPGNIGMLSQSGALGLAILDSVKERGLGLSNFASVGNKADVSGNDLLAYWAEDAATEVVLLYLESFGNPRKFARVAPAVGRIKPIVALKSGRSTAGSRAASSHSAALASPETAVTALFEQAGVVRVDTMEEMFDVAELLALTVLPAGPRMGVITNAGGPGILLADAGEALGLTFPALTPATLAALRTFLPAAAGLSNPIDMIASATPEQYERALKLVGNDPAVDAAIAIYIPPQVSRPEEIAAAIARGAAEVPKEKPVVTVFITSESAPATLHAGGRGKLPAYRYPENAVRAMARAEGYARWRRRKSGRELALEDEARAGLRGRIDALRAAHTGPFWLEQEDVMAVLECAGIRVAKARQVRVEDAPRAAGEMGFPLVAKAVAPGLLHKSDVGAVLMGLDSTAAVEKACRELEQRVRAAGSSLEAVLLQQQAGAGVDFLVGVTTDRTFGPLLVCGMGGVLVELVRDVSFRLTPVTDLEAREMLAELRAAKLLDGYRGSPAADRAALVETIQRVSALVELVPELLEMDINPLRLFTPGQGAVVLDARIRLG